MISQMIFPLRYMEIGIPDQRKLFKYSGHLNTRKVQILIIKNGLVVEWSILYSSQYLKTGLKSQIEMVAKIKTRPNHFI
jgi:hypothetical protein